MPTTSASVEERHQTVVAVDEPLATFGTAQTTPLDYADPTERRLVRLERSLGFWRVLALLNVFVAVILMWLFAYYIFPKLIHA